MQRHIVAAAAALAAFLIAGFAATPRAQGPAAATRPLRLSAFAVNMSTVQAPASTAVMDIRIKRWSTREERERLIATAIEKGPAALLRALQRMPDHGRISIPAWRGPDPHNARLGWTLHYASVVPAEDGGLRIGIATDRYIGMWEARTGLARSTIPSR